MASRLPISKQMPKKPVPTLKRLPSPEVQSHAGFSNKRQLRRSKSAADLNRPGTSKRAGEPPEKFLKLGHLPINRAAKPPPKLIKSSSLTTNNLADAKKLNTKPLPSAAAAPTKAKRIPAYDFKARFADLQEKHKALREKFDAAQEKLEQLDNLPYKYEESQRNLSDKTVALDAAEQAVNHMKIKEKQNDEKIFSLGKSVSKLTQELTLLKDKHEVLVTEHRLQTHEYKESTGKIMHLTTENNSMKEELLKLRELLFKSNVERKELHNAIMDLRGNIRVFCRVRPPLEEEENRELCGWQYLDESSLEITSNELVSTATSNRPKYTKHDFMFDQVFHPRSGQDDIFELVSPLIQSALDGYNICIFAYGQTGSGKTYTMDGTHNQAGINPRTVDLLFDCVDNYKQLGWQYRIKVTFLEIYNEVLYDLLSNDIKDMDIRMVNAKNPHEIYVTNITEITVENAVELRELMKKAKANRATASTAGNERSSRSHAVTRLQLIGTHSKKNETCIGTINLIDLAGSESPKTSVRMEETKKINKSLSELTNVIMALMQKQEHIPYRNSRLTYLLMPSLGGNSKTLMFINVAPFQDCFTETIKSLRFAASVKSCKMTKAKKNKFMDTSNSHQLSSSNSFGN